MRAVSLKESRWKFIDQGFPRVLVFMSVVGDDAVEEWRWVSLHDQQYEIINPLRIVPLLPRGNGFLEDEKVRRCGHVVKNRIVIDVFTSVSCDTRN